MKTILSLHQSMWRLLTLIICVAIMSGCSSDSSTGGLGTGGTGTLSGIAKVDITDASGTGYANVYVTITGVAFHSDKKAQFSNYSSGKVSGWQIFRLAVPKTVDLTQLSGGTTYSDLNGASLFDGLPIPVGNYNQMRLFLASTEDAYVGSLAGLTYNNEVLLNGDNTEYPLRVPAAGEGIKVLPESPVVIASGNISSLTLDFKLGDDVVAVSPNGSTEFVLKPRLGYFDMGNVGEIKGKISFGNLTSSGIEVKAEQIDGSLGYRVVRRTTSINKTSGKFTLFPLPIFGNATTAVYDILLRGNNVQTSIIKGVKIHRRSSPTTATYLKTITIQPGSEFTAQVGSVIHPTGMWMNFYQTIAGDSVPFEVRYRHLDPYTGLFKSALELSTEPIQVATYSPGISPVFVADNTSQGKFSMVANAVDLYTGGTPISGIRGTAGQTVLLTMATNNYPQMIPGASPGTVNCVFDMTLLGTGTGPGMGAGNRTVGNPSKGQVFITYGGMIIDSIGSVNSNTTIADAMRAGGGTNNPVTLTTNLPSNVAGAVYGIYALGWGRGVFVGSNTLSVDLRSEMSSLATLLMR